MSNDNFQKCCNNPNRVKYSITHDPKPIQLTKGLFKAIEYLLWYVPDISSAQSEKSETADLISNKLLNDFLFEYIMKLCGLTDSDVMWVESGEIPKSLCDYYQNDMCTSCQKLILSQTKNRTKTECMLGHIRNSIAHGRFTVCNGMLVSFDTNPKRKKSNSPISEYTAIIKIKPNKLLGTLRELDSGLTKQKIYEYAFKKLHYKIVPQTSLENSLFKGNKKFIFNFILSKQQRLYAVELKVSKDKRYIYPKTLALLIKRFKTINNDICTPVIIIDTARLTVAEKKQLTDENIKILDINSMNSLLNGNDPL